MKKIIFLLLAAVLAVLVLAAFVFRDNQTGVVTPVQVWVYHADGGISNAAVVDSMVYAVSDDGFLLQINLNDGKLIQKIKLPAELSDPFVAVKNNEVWIGDANGNVLGVDGVAGKILWSFAADGKVRGINAGGGNVYFGSYGSKLYCLERWSGKLVKEFSGAGYVNSAPAVGNNLAVFADCGGQLSVVRNAAELTTLALGDYIPSSPVLFAEGRAAVINYSGSLKIVDIDRMQVLNEINLGNDQPYLLSPVAAGAALAVVSGRGTVIVYQTGDWQELARVELDRKFTAAEVSEGKLILSSEDGMIFALGMPELKPLWKIDTLYSFQDRFTVVNNSLLIADEDGNLYCYRNL